jgi:hypothetical protein
MSLRRVLWALVGVAMVVVAIIALRGMRRMEPQGGWRPDLVSPPGPQVTLPPREPSPGHDSPGAAPAAPPSPAPEPSIPEGLPTPEPGLDQQLAGDYRRALEAHGSRVVALAITDRRASSGIRRADIVYRPASAGPLATLRPEIARIFGPGANPKLALDQITVRAVRPGGTVIVAVTASVADVDRWLRNEITDKEFYATWSVSVPK